MTYTLRLQLSPPLCFWAWVRCRSLFFAVKYTGSSSTVKAAAKRKRGRPCQSPTPSCVLNEVNEGCWWLRWVHKIRRKVGTKWGLSWQPIDLQNFQVNLGKKNPSTLNLMVFMQWFRKHPDQMKFKYDHADCKWINVDTIIWTITVSYNSMSKIYTLDHVDATTLNEFFSTRT